MRRYWDLLEGGEGEDEYMCVCIYLYISTLAHVLVARASS
jgi:hypothetical protein